MHALSPPVENQVATRAAVIELARVKLWPLLGNGGDLDSLPAWLWAVPTHAIANILSLAEAPLASHLARLIEAETDARYPAERYVAYLAARHPMLSHVQRARLAEFTNTYARLRQSGDDVHTRDMVAQGYSYGECEHLLPRAEELIAALAAEVAESPYEDRQPPIEALRTAGRTAHTRRAYAEGDLELCPADAAPTTTGAAA